MGITAEQLEKQREQKQRVVRMSLTLIIYSVLMLGYAGYKIGFALDRKYSILAGISIGLILTALVVLRLNHQGRPSGARAAEVTAFLMIGMVWIAILVTSVYYSGSGFNLALLGFFFIALVSARVFSRQQIIIILSFTLVIGVMAFLMDWYGSAVIKVAAARPELFPTWIVRGITIAVVTMVLLVLIVRFRTYPLRTKLLFSFMVISALSAVIVAWVSVVNAQNSLKAAAQQSLLTASSQVANSVDSFFYAAMEAIETEAQFPVFQEYLSFPLDQRTDEAFAVIDDTFRVLKQRTSINRISNTRLTALQAYMLLDKDGTVVVDTSMTSLGENHSSYAYFDKPMTNPKTYVSPVQFNTKGQPVFYLGTRVNDVNEQAIGILVARYSGNVLQQIIQENNSLVGAGSFAILIDENGLRLGQGLVKESLYRFLQPLSMEKITELKESGGFPGQSAGEGSAADYMTIELADLSPQIASLGNRSSLSFRLGSDNEVYLAANTQLKSQSDAWQVLYIQSENELLAPIERQVRNTEILALLIAAAAAFAAIPLSRILTDPVRRLTAVTDAVTSGNLNARAKVETEDEIGILANAINQMTGELQQNLIGLEQRVGERTRDLEKRSVQLQAVTEIGRAAATIRNPDELLSRVTQLISERFDIYHVGIFLIEEEGTGGKAHRFAVLRAANSEGGQRMLARGHKLDVGQQGIVGYVTGTGNPRIALDVGEDSQYFNNPDLPMTRSEMALALSIGGKIIGALDVQSIQAGAFAREDVAILQVMADLVAIAIENARLFTDSKEALETSRRAYGELSRRAWIEMLSSSEELSYTSLEYPYLTESEGKAHRVVLQKPLALPTTGAEGGIEHRGGNDQPQMESTTGETGETTKEEEDALTYPLSLPIKVRDTVIGYLDTYKPMESGSWTPEEYDMVTTIIDQLGVALESARLYGSSQSQAERERLIGEVASRMRESLDVDAVLRTAVQELRRSLGISQVEVRIKRSQNNG